MDIVRVGLTNLINVLDFEEDDELDREVKVWPFEQLAKKSILLFDQLAVSMDLDITIEMADSITGYSNHRVPNTLRFLREKGLLFDATRLGFQSGKAFVDTYINGIAKEIEDTLLVIADSNLDPDLIGQPDFSNYLGFPVPRLGQARQLGITPEELISRYHSLVARRDAAILRNAGLYPTIIGSLYERSDSVEGGVNSVWKVILNEIPQLDNRISWQDILDFRQDENTQHLVRSLRNWVRKIVSENMEIPDLQDEIRELVFKYEQHVKIARMSASKGPVEFIITGTAQLAEDLIKLRLKNIAKIASVYRNYKIELLKAESEAKGRELALIPKIKEWIS